MTKKIFIFTDGSINKKKGLCSSAFCIIREGHMVASMVSERKGSNSLAEVTAVLEAMERLVSINGLILETSDKKSDYEFILVSDSQYVIKSINEYSINWIKNGIDSIWIGSNRKQVMYQEEFRKILKMRDELKNIKFVHIYSHLDSDLKFDNAYEKFCEQYHITKVQFKEFTKYNNLVDKLAYNKIN